MARATITRPGSETSGTAGRAPGVLAGARAGRPGMIGASITDLAGVAAMAQSPGPAVTLPGPGGDPTGTAGVRAASWLGGRVTRQTPLATFTPGGVTATALACASGPERTQRLIMRAHTIPTPAPWPPVNAQA